MVAGSGGGGGGSSFGPAGAIFQDDVQEGNGFVQITYDPDAGTCPTEPTTTTTTAAGTDPTSTTAAASPQALTPSFTG